MKIYLQSEMVRSISAEWCAEWQSATSIRLSISSHDVMRHIEDRADENIQVWLLLHFCKKTLPTDLQNYWKVLICKKRIAGFADILLNTATLLQRLTWQFSALTPVATNALQWMQIMRRFPVHNALVATMLSCCCCHVVLQTGLRGCKKRRLKLFTSDYFCWLLLLIVGDCHYCCQLFLFTRSSVLVFLLNADWSALVHLTVLQKEAAAPAAGARQANSSCSNSFIKMQ